MVLYDAMAAAPEGTVLPTTPRTSPVIHSVIPGVSALTALGRPACVTLERLREDAHELLASGTGSFAYSPTGAGERVLGVCTDTVLVDDSLLDVLVGDYVTRIEGMSPYCDPQTALFDVQWQVNLQGREVRALDGPSEVGPSASPDARRRRRAGLLSLMSSHLGDRLRGPLLGAAELLDVTHDLARGGADTTALDLQRSPGGDEIGTLDVPAEALEGAFAVDGALDALERPRTARRDIQAVRRLPDAAILPLIRSALPALLDLTPGREAAFDRLSAHLHLDAVLAEPLRLVLATASPESAARAEAVAKALEGCAVVHRVDLGDVEVTADVLRTEGTWADAVAIVGGTTSDAPGLLAAGRPLLVDLSDLDLLEYLTHEPRTESRGRLLQDTCLRGDRFLVADDGQRDLLLGMLAGIGRVNDVVYDADPSLRDLVSVESGANELIRFCEAPVLAADRVRQEAPATAAAPSDLVLAVQYLREGGVRNVATKAVGRMRRLTAERKAH